MVAKGKDMNSSEQADDDKYDKRRWPQVSQRFGKGACHPEWGEYEMRFLIRDLLVGILGLHDLVHLENC